MLLPRFQKFPAKYPKSKNFLRNLPTIRHEKNYTCRSCAVGSGRAGRGRRRQLTDAGHASPRERSEMEFVHRCRILALGDHKADFFNDTHVRVRSFRDGVWS